MIYKIPLQRYIPILALMFFIHVTPTSAQDRVTSKYGVPVIVDVKIYFQSVLFDSAMTMKELKAVIPDIEYDLRYATVNNFTRRRMYPKNTKQTFLRAPAAAALLKVQQELHKQGLGLLVFDAYRPYGVTVDFWELIKDERYVANPSSGSGHNRGLAVDLTIINLTTRKPLDMGTSFDHFSDTAHHSFNGLPENVLQNRKLLLETMEKYGFKRFDTEWWHYSWPNNKEYDVLDIPFNKLARPFPKKVVVMPPLSRLKP